MARLNSVAGQYISAEAANVQKALVNAVNAPAELLLGHPLYGTGQGGAAANAAANHYANSFNWSESFNTPFGALTLSSKTTGTFYADGPVTTTLSAHVPGASLLWSYGGEFSGGGTTLQFAGVRSPCHSYRSEDGAGQVWKCTSPLARFSLPPNLFRRHGRNTIITAQIRRQPRPFWVLSSPIAAHNSAAFFGNC